MEQIPVGPFAGHPVERELWLILAEKVRAEFPAVEFREAKTQIGVAEGRTFAAVSLPRARDMGAGQGAILLSLSLACPDAGPRVAACVLVSANRYTCHIPIRSAAEIDEELLNYIRMARAVPVRGRKG